MNNHLVCSQSTRTDLLLMTMMWTLTPSQNQTCRWNPRSFLHRVNDRVRKMLDQSSKDATKDSDKHSLIWWTFMSSTLQASVFMGKNYSETYVWHICKVDSRTIRWDLWSEYNWLGTLFMETFIFDRWWRSHQSLAREGLRIFRFCIVPWKDERETTIKYCMGRQIDVVQKFIRIQNFGHNWWWANGIRVEYFPRIHHIAALQQSPIVHVKNERKTIRIFRTDHLHVDVPRHLMEISKQ